MYWLKLNLLTRAYFDGDDDTNTDNTDPTKVKDGDGNKPKLLTQEQVDRIIADERRKNDQKYKAVVDKLETVSKNESLTKKEREQLAEQIEAIKNASLTKEQALLRDHEALQKKYKEDVAEKENQTKTWQERHNNLLVNHTIQAAAVANDAFRPEQLLTILRGNAKLIEKKTDDGVPTGEYQVLFPFQDTDAKTKEPINVDLDAESLMKRMKELPDTYGNLFKSTMGSGTGSGGGSKKGNGNPVVADMTPEEFRAYRENRKKTQGY